MSKIVFKLNGKKQNEEIPEEEAKLPEPEPSDETAATADAAADASFDAPKPKQSKSAKVEPVEDFDKDKIVKYFKRHPKKAVNTKVDRFNPKLTKGL